MKGGTLLVFSLFAVMLTCWLVNPALSEWLALGLMICAGIPHGSFDLRVAEAKWKREGVSQTAILAGYLLCVFGMSALCVFSPLVGLALFLVISAIHFSEGEKHSRLPPTTFQGVLFGVGAIVLPIGMHLSEAQAYVSYFIPEELFTSAQGVLSLAAWVLGVLMAITIARDLLSVSGWRDPNTVERFVCLCAWVFLPPLSGFAVWFIGRHSRQHLEVCKEMFRQGRFAIPLDFAVISLLAIVGLLPFALLFDFSKIEQLFAASICLIAGLTLPHMIVSHRMREVVH